MTLTADSHVLITGGSSGIGLALARHYARLGCRLTLIARNPDRLNSAANELRQAGAGVVETLPVDLSDTEAANTTLSESVQRTGLPDLVINAAGVVRPGAFIELSKEAFDENLRADFDTTVTVCRLFAPLMVERGRGQLLIVSSMAGFLGIYGYSGYAAAKFALMGFAEALRFELKPAGVGVSVLCPPDTDTPGFAAECAERPLETTVISGAIKPVSPDFVAQAAVRGLAKGTFLILPGATGKFYFRLKGLLPELYRAIVDSDIRRTRKMRAAGDSAPLLRDTV